MTYEQRPGDPFAGPGEMRALCRSHDWTSNPLGPVAQWPQALRTIVRATLDSPFPVNLWCGPELILIYNDAYRQVLGSKHPALGLSGRDVWSDIWPQIQPMFARISEGGPPLFAEDAPFATDRGITGDMPEAVALNAWFTFSLSPVRDEEGEIVAFLNIVSESTPRVLAERAREAALQRVERAEARLREVFTQAPAFMAVVRGEDHVFEYVNEAYYRLVGQRQLLGRPVFEALPELRGQGFHELLGRVFESGEPYVGRELPVLLTRHPDTEPERRFVDFIFYPITDPDGSDSGVVTHGYDVTDHVLSRQEAHRARTEAEEANRAKSQFLANMSHEIRTPLNAIIGYTELLEMGVAGELNERQRDQLARVRTSSGHLLRLVDDILDVARIEAGRMKVEHVRFPAAISAGAALALVAPLAEQKRIRLEAHFPAGPATIFVGDDDRVRQILVNLISNAVKFTEGEGAVTVTCGSATPPAGETDLPEKVPMTFIRVSDTGIGIGPAELESIFRPFQQVEGGHTRTRGGSGLGLTISRHLARLMGGDLTVESQPGRGSTFTLWLPADAAATVHGVHVQEAEGEELPPNLTRVGEALQAAIPTVLARYRERLRGDAAIPNAAGIDPADLDDHAATFLADVAHGLIVLERSPGPAHLHLQDGDEIQEVIARLHGQQRARLGWGADALAREWKIMTDVVAEAVRESLPHTEVDGSIRFLSRILARAERISRRSLQQADRARHTLSGAGARG